MSSSESEKERQVAAGRTAAETTIRRSVFRAVAAPATDREQALAEVEAARLRHPDARHHCWAWQGRRSAASSDDGEPSGTAGRPILNVIGHKAISDVVVVVSRDFGGIKLGAGGLVRAYAGAAEAALSSMPMSVDRPMIRCRLVMDFAMEQPLRHWLAGQPSMQLATIDYAEAVHVALDAPVDALESLEAWCAARGVTCRR